MKTFVVFALLLTVYVAALFATRATRTCEPYEPTEHCEDGIYRIYLFEKPWIRYPSARIDAHCVYTKPGRVVAQVVRFITYFEYPLQDEISGVWWAEEQEFPPLSPDRISLCRVL